MHYKKEKIISISRERKNFTREEQIEKESLVCKRWEGNRQKKTESEYGTKGSINKYSEAYSRIRVTWRNIIVHQNCIINAIIFNGTSIMIYQIRGSHTVFVFSLSRKEYYYSKPFFCGNYQEIQLSCHN